MRVIQNILIASVFFIVPSASLAYGQEFIFMPIGQITAIVVVSILLWRLPFRGIAIRLISVISVIGVTLPLWFASNSWFPPFLWSEIGFFLIGLIPSIVVVTGIFLLHHAIVQRSKNA